LDEAAWTHNTTGCGWRLAARASGEEFEISREEPSNPRRRSMPHMLPSDPGNAAAMLSPLAHSCADPRDVFVNSNFGKIGPNMAIQAKFFPIRSLGSVRRGN
jgi:hypothetical protein